MRFASAWTPVVVLLVALTAASGCLFKDDGGVKSATFTTKWTQDQYHYVLEATGTPTKHFKVVLSASGTEEEIGRDRLIDLGDGRWEVPATFTPKSGDVVRLVAQSGSKNAGEREITVHDSELDQPKLTAKADYTMDLQLLNTTETNWGDMRIAGTVHLDATPSRVRWKMSASGSLNQSGEGMVIRLSIPTMEKAEENGKTTKILMTGHGTWTMDDYYTGSGAVPVQRTEFLGYEKKRDRAGHEYECEKTRDHMEMNGVLHAPDGNTTTFESMSETTEWARVDTGEVIWHQGVSYSNYTANGETTPLYDEFDEAPHPDEEPETQSLLDFTDFSGLEPNPIVLGDVFDEKGQGGFTIRYEVSDGGSRTAAGRSFTTFKVIGTVRSGGTGTETWYVARDAGLLGLPLSMEGNYQLGQEAASTTVRLTSLT